MPRPLPKHRAREYETVFIVHPETPSDGVEQISNRLSDVIGRLNGRLLRAENWGRRRLAYPVRKANKGVYLYLKYLGYSDMVAELERNLRMIEPVIKFITVKLEEDVDPETRMVREGDINFVAQFEEEPEREVVEAASPVEAERSPAPEPVAEPAPEPEAKADLEVEPEAKVDLKVEPEPEAKVETADEASPEPTTEEQGK